MALISADVRTTGDAFDPGRVDSESAAVYRQQLTGAGLYVEGEVRRGTPAYTGDLQKNWFTEYRESAKEVLVANPSEYALPMEFGRKPAWVPIEPLTLWVRRKLGVSDQKKAKGIAFVISRKKSQQPTPGVGFARTAFEASIDVVNASFLQPIGAELVKRLSV